MFLLCALFIDFGIQRNFRYSFCYFLCISTLSVSFEFLLLSLYLHILRPARNELLEVDGGIWQQHTVCCGEK